MKSSSFKAHKMFLEMLTNFVLALPNQRTQKCSSHLRIGTIYRQLTINKTVNDNGRQLMEKWS